MSIPPPVSHYMARNQGCSKKAGNGRIETRRKMPLFLRQNYKTVFKYRQSKMCCTYCILHIGSVLVESTRKNAVRRVTEGHTERANVIQSYLIETS